MFGLLKDILFRQRVSYFIFSNDHFFLQDFDSIQTLCGLFSTKNHFAERSFAKHLDEFEIFERLERKANQALLISEQPSANPTIISLAGDLKHSQTTVHRARPFFLSLKPPLSPIKLSSNCHSDHWIHLDNNNNVLENRWRWKQPAKSVVWGHHFFLGILAQREKAPTLSRQVTSVRSRKVTVSVRRRWPQHRVALCFKSVLVTSSISSLIV